MKCAATAKITQNSYLMMFISLENVFLMWLVLMATGLELGNIFNHALYGWL